MSKHPDSYDQSAAAFCDEVMARAQHLGLRIFLVAVNDKTQDGSSCTLGEKRGDKDDAVHNAREAHRAWERAHGINPDHERHPHPPAFMRY